MIGTERADTTQAKVLSGWDGGPFATMADGVVDAMLGSEPIGDNVRLLVLAYHGMVAGPMVEMSSTGLRSRVSDAAEALFRYRWMPHSVFVVPAHLPARGSPLRVRDVHGSQPTDA